MNSDHNPYQVPQADVAKVMSEGEFHGPRSTPGGNGTRWVSDAWRLFKVSPGVWLAMMLVYVVCQMVIAMIPFAGSLFGPVFMAGFFRASQTAAEEGVVRLEEVFSGFRERLGSLMLVGVLTVAFIAGIVILAMVVGFAGLGVTGFDASNGAAALIPILILSLVVAGLVMPVIMMGWFAPALVIFQGMGAYEAMKCSFRACLLNIMAFTVYSLVLLLFFIACLIPVGIGLALSLPEAVLLLAAIPSGLALLLAFPILLLSLYTSYHDIFIAND